MTYFLANEDGGTADFASVQGLREFRAWADAQDLPTVHALLNDGFTDDLNALRSEVATLMTTDEHVSESLRALQQSARDAREVLILSQGENNSDDDDDEDESEMDALLSVLEDAIRAGNTEVITETLGLRSAYSEDQERDDHGRWVKGGGTGDASTDHIQGTMIGRPVSAYPPVNPDTRNTEKRFSTDGGKTFTKERTALHTDIKAHFADKATPVEKPRVLMMGGGPASGKSSMNAQHPGGANFVDVNADGIRELFPEFQARAMAGERTNDAASSTHDEASTVSKDLIAESLAAGKHIRFDGTGNSDIDGLAAKVAKMRAAGHGVDAEYATLPTEKALALMYARGDKSGRYVPEDVLRATHRGVSRVFPEALARGLFDNVKLWNTDIHGQPRLIVSGQGKDYVIHDHALWDEFLAKGRE